MKNAELLTQWENAVNRVATSWKAKSSSAFAAIILLHLTTYQQKLGQLI